MAGHYSKIQKAFTAIYLPKLPNSILSTVNASSTNGVKGPQDPHGNSHGAVTWTYCKYFSFPELHSKSAAFQAFR
jgi:hypothetical protein